MNVTLTKDFRLTSDERNFIVERRVVVDPTRSPSWAARKAADPTLSDAVKEEWREDTSPYYPLNAVGLTAAIQNVVIRQAITDVAASAKLADFLALIQREMRTVTDAVDALLKPAPSAHFTVNADAAEYLLNGEVPDSVVSVGPDFTPTPFIKRKEAKE